MTSPSRRRGMRERRLRKPPWDRHPHTDSRAEISHSTQDHWPVFVFAALLMRRDLSTINSFSHEFEPRRHLMERTCVLRRITRFFSIGESPFNLSVRVRSVRVSTRFKHGHPSLNCAHTPKFSTNRKSGWRSSASHS